jgi:hypothetical protein
MSSPEAESRDDTQANSFVITALGLISPITVYYISKVVGFCITILLRAFGITTASTTWSMLVHFLVCSSNAAQSIFLLLKNGGEPSDCLLPMEELNLAFYLVGQPLYNFLLGYTIYVVGGPLSMLSRVTLYVARPRNLWRIFIFLTSTHIGIRLSRSFWIYELREVLWKGYPIISPLEFLVLLDSEERMTAWNSLVVLASDRATSILSYVRTFFPASIGMETTIQNIDDYHFRPLDNIRGEIRLLFVDRPSRFTPAIYTLINVPLQDAPKYEAISYTWDGQETDQVIIVDGSRLLVTENARRIIESRVSSQRTRCLWIDAICINQKDELEKSTQVSIMGKIYSSAAVVTVWLESDHPAPSDALLACSLLGALYRRSNSTTSSKRHNSPLGGSSAWKWFKCCLDFNWALSVRQEVEQLGTYKMWQALERLLTHDYWFRIWIIQEISQAKRVKITYGGIWIDWNVFSGIIIRHVRHGPLNQIVSHCGLLSGIDLYKFSLGMLQIARISQCEAIITGQATASLAEILSTTLQADSKDPRDQIFGMYSIIQRIPQTDDILSRLKPNYNVSSQELFFNFSSGLLKWDPDFVFNRSGVGRCARLVNLPSWVVDWSQKRDNPALAWTEHENELFGSFRYRAGGSESFYYEVKSHGILKLRGIIVGCVSELTNDLYPSTCSLNILDTSGRYDILPIKEFLRDVKKYHDGIMATARCTPEVYALTSQPRQEALWRTIVRLVFLEAPFFFVSHRLRV